MRPWPPVLRAAAGGAAGWAAIRWGVTEPEPSWAAGSAAAVAAAGGLAAPAVARGAGAPVVTGWAAASVLGLYLGVPETDHVVGVAAVIAVLVLTSLAAPRQASWLLVAGLDVVLVWAAVRGAPGGGPALAAALAVPGLLVVAPLTSHLPGPRRALAPVSVQPAVLVRCRQVSPSSSPASLRTVTRSSRRPRSPSPRSSCSFWRRGWPSGPGRGEAGDRPRHRRHAARRHGPAAGGDRGRRADRRRSAGAVPPGAERARRPAVRARQVPHDAAGAARRRRAAARCRARHPRRPGPAVDEPRRAADPRSRRARRDGARRAAAATGRLPPPLRRHAGPPPRGSPGHHRLGPGARAQHDGVGRTAGPRRLVRRPRVARPRRPHPRPHRRHGPRWRRHRPCPGRHDDRVPGTRRRAGRGGARCASPT